MFPFGPKYAAMVESSDEALVLKLIFWRPMAEYLWDRKEIIKAVMARTETVEEEKTMKNTIKIRPAPPPI